MADRRRRPVKRAAVTDRQRTITFDIGGFFVHNKRILTWLGLSKAINNAVVFDRQRIVIDKGVMN